MKIILPLELDASHLTGIVSTNVTNIVEPWDTVTNYVVGEFSTRDNISALFINGIVWKCIVDNGPSTTVAEPGSILGETYWQNYSADNQWKPFDSIVGNPSTNEHEIMYEIATDSTDIPIGGLALFNVVGTEVTVIVDDPDNDGVIYYKRVPLIKTSDVYDWYSYFFNPVTGVTNISFIDLPLENINTATTTVNITSKKTSETARWDWDTDGDAEGWGFGTGSGVVTNGTLEVTNTSSGWHSIDTYFGGVSEFPEIIGSTYNKIRCRVRLKDTGTGWPFLGRIIYYYSGGNASLDISPPNPAAPTVDDQYKWFIYEWDFSGEASWIANDMYRIEFMLFDGDDAVFEIDWMEVISESNISERWYFQEKGNLDGWYADSASESVDNGVCTVINDSAPIYSSFTRGGLNIDTTKYDRVRARIRVIDQGPSYAWNGGIVYTTDQTYSSTFFPEPEWDISEWQIYDFDMSGETGWTLANLSLYQFRLFITDDVEYEVDWVEFIANDADSVSLGELVIGELVDIGLTQKGVTLGIVDYSSKTQDEFGNIEILPRTFSKRSNTKLIVPTEDINQVSNILNSIRTSPIAWVLLEDVDFASSVLIYGYAKDYNMVVSNPLWATLSLQIEGLT